MIQKIQSNSDQKFKAAEESDSSTEESTDKETDTESSTTSTGYKSGSDSASSEDEMPRPPKYDQNANSDMGIGETDQILKMIVQLTARNLKPRKNLTRASRS